MGEVSPELNQIEQTFMKNDFGKLLPVVKFRFKLASPVSLNMYTYLHENAKVYDVSYVKKDVIVPFKNTIERGHQLKNPIPLYNFYAAAGSFSEMQSAKDFILIEGPDNIKINSGFFACKVVGESMNRVISNGSICLFKLNTEGSRDGKIVLIENMDVQDPDFNSAFTIKTYSSKKEIFEGTWKHTSIVLRPNSYDVTYQNTVINEEEAKGMRVIGEFVKILTS